MGSDLPDHRRVAGGRAQDRPHPIRLHRSSVARSVREPSGRQDVELRVRRQQDQVARARLPGDHLFAGRHPPHAGVVRGRPEPSARRPGGACRDGPHPRSVSGARRLSRRRPLLMLTALLASAGAALFGSGDFLGGVASRKSPALAVSAVMYAVGAVLLMLLLGLVRPQAVAGGDFAWAVSSGVFGTIGVLALYAALATGRMSVVAPLTAGLSGAGPAAFDLLRGTHVGASALLGITLALLAVVVVSTTKGTVEEHGMPTKAVVLSILSGAAFACS